MVRKRPGNNEMREPNYNGQFNAPSHMLTLADVKALQEDTQVGGKIKLGGLKKFGKDFGKGFVTGFTGVKNSGPGKLIIGEALNRAMPGATNMMTRQGLDPALSKSLTVMGRKAVKDKTGFGYNPYMTDVEHMEGAGFGSMIKKAASNKMVKGLAKAALKEATPMMSNAIANRTGLDPSLSKQLTKAVVSKVNDQVIGSGLVGIYDKGPAKRTRKKAGPSDKRSRRGAVVSQLMREHGMTLAQASRYIRDNGIEY